MHDEALRKLEFISGAVGTLVEYAQGGGGNTSVKLNGELMAVKASGFKLRQVTAEDGYVIVNYRNIGDYFRNVDINACDDFEKESKETVSGNVIAREGKKPLRPSVEAGFHSILKKYVIHTHSVYANMICCTRNGRETLERIPEMSDFGYIWIPYTNPGASLTVRMNEEINGFLERTGVLPNAVFMENHGLVVTAEDSKACVELHGRINSLIKRFLGMNGAFPEITLSEIDEHTVVSNTQYLRDYFKGSGITAEFFDRNVLYPDQLVYLSGNISVGGADKKVNINTKTGEIIYKAGLSEALALEEILLAYVYVISGIERNNLPLKTMSESEIAFIANWESEAYRRMMMKGGKA